MIAVVLTSRVVVFDGRPWAADLGARPGTIPAWDAKAACWLRDPQVGDLAKAQAWCKSETAKRAQQGYTDDGIWTAWEIPSKDPAPLDTAKAKALALRGTP